MPLPEPGQRSAAWLYQEGMPEPESHALVTSSISNPRALKPVLDYVGSQYGDDAARHFLNLRANAIVAGAVAGSAGAMESSAPEAPPPAYDWSQQDW